MYLNEALYASKIKPIFCHHEQAAAMAAEAYGRITGLGVVMVTAGPGAMNTLNGVMGAWCDSSPLLVISGTNNLKDVLYMKKRNMRQVGLQGVNIEPIVKPFVKYFKTLDSFQGVEEAYNQATTDRKGPVWVEIPLDIQNLS